MFGTLWSLVIYSFREPRAAAQAVLRLPLGDGGRWAAFGLMVVVSAALMFFMFSLTPLVGPDGTMMPAPGPFFLGLTVGGGMLVLTGLAYGIGRLFGGTARLGDMVILVAWLQFLQLVLAVAQLVLMVLVPMLDGVMEVLSLVAFLWLLTAFVAEGHGFRSMASVAGGVVATFVVMVLVMTVLLYPFMLMGV